MRPQHSSSLSPWNIGGHRLDGPPTMAASHALPYGTLWKTRARIRRVKIGPQEREGFINRRSLRFSFLFFFCPRYSDKGRDQFNFSLAGWIEWKDRSGRNREENRARVPRDFCFRLPSRGNIYKRRCLLLVFSRDYRK